jgi:glycyl-tRNA synthetase
MAHYASDCWDAEVETSFGWIEVAGHADRSCFDLTKHSEETKVELVAARPLKEPKLIKFIRVTVEKPKIGKTFKKDAKKVTEIIEGWTDQDHERLLNEMEEKKEITIEANGNELKLPQDMIKFEREEKTIHEEKYVPHVIEPSFGIGRILYCVFEHAFKMREADAQRTYFLFRALVAPIKCSLLPLMTKPDLVKKSYELKQLLTSAGMSSKLDDSGQTVGKRYARTDECGIPFAFTIDYDTLEDNTVTMREIDTMKQIRLPMGEAP